MPAPKRLNVLEARKEQLIARSAAHRHALVSAVASLRERRRAVMATLTQLRGWFALGTSAASLLRRPFLDRVLGWLSRRRKDESEPEG